jgi:opacity protein-like surface antigen
VKKFVIAAGATLALMTVAHAADLPHPQPVYEQPAVGKMPIGKAPVGKGPVGKGPVVAPVPGPVVRRGY